MEPDNYLIASIEIVGNLGGHDSWNGTSNHSAHLYYLENRLGQSGNFFFCFSCSFLSIIGRIDFFLLRGATNLQKRILNNKNEG
jgi:predicted RNA-binding protein with PUA-like domain